MKVLFFGTPQIAVPFLEYLSAHTQVVGVVARPDEPAGRGYELKKPATKIFAESKNIPVFQPTGPWTSDTTAALKNLKADLGIVVAYGRIMPRDIFMAPQLGCVNIHFSLLPKYRGAAPMQWSLINGERETGVSAFWLEEGLDSGPLFMQKKTAIGADDDAAALREKLVKDGVALLGDLIAAASAGKIVKNSQQGEVTLAPPLKKEMGAIDWTQPAEKIRNLMRGLSEWPGTYTRFSVAGAPSKLLKIFKASVRTGGKGTPGAIVAVEKNVGFIVKAGEGALLVTEVQPEGKKAMSAWAFWQGAHMKEGDVLGK